MYDKDTILSLAEDLMDLENKRQKVKEEKKELDDEIAQLYMERQNWCKVSPLAKIFDGWHNFLEERIDLENNPHRREYQMLIDYVNGDTLTGIAENNDLTRERVRQLVEKAKRLFRRTCPTLKEMRDERHKYESIIDSLNAENLALKERLKECEILNTKIKNGEIKPNPAKEKLLNTSVSELPLSIRAQNCLKWAGIETVGQLVAYERTQLLNFRNFGKKSLHEIDEALASRGLYFGMNINAYLYS